MVGDVLVLLSTVLALSVLSAVFAVVLYYLYSGNLDTKHALVVKANGQDQPGIPFYIRKSRATHETSYLEALATYTLKATSILRESNEKPVHSTVEYIHTKTISLSRDTQNILREVEAAIADAQNAPGIPEKVTSWNQAREAFERENLPSYNGSLPAVGTMQVESNTVKLESYVDYATPYYLNKRLPFSGSSEFAIELAADGTLSKSSVKEENTTLSTIAGMIPTDTLFAKPEAEAATDQTKTTTKRGVTLDAVVITQDYEYTLTADYFHIRHVFFKPIEDREAVTPKVPLPPIANVTWYRREVVPSATKKDDTDKPATTKKDDTDKPTTT